MDDGDRAQSLSDCWLADRLRASQSVRLGQGLSGKPGVPPEDRPCARCGETIGQPRLAALPEAHYCVDCQDEIETMLRRAP